MLFVHTPLELLRKLSFLFFPAEVGSHFVLVLACCLCMFVPVVHVTLANEHLIGFCDDIVVVMSMFESLLRFGARCLEVIFCKEALAEGFGE